MTARAEPGRALPTVAPDTAGTSGHPKPPPAPGGRPLREGLFLALLVILLLLPARPWVWRNLAVPTGDEATHLLACLTFQENFERADSPGDWLTPALSWRDHNAYPPLVYQVVGMTSALSGGLELGDLACLNLGWVALATLAVYILGRRLFGASGPSQGRLVGALAALVVGFSPLLLTQVPTFLLDLPAAATFLAALALLACSTAMEHRGRALLVGVSIAAVALTKWLTILSLLPALLYVSWHVHQATPRRERAALAGGLAGLATALAGAAGLALRFPPPAEPALNALNLTAVGGWVAGLGATCLAVLTLAFRRVRHRPARNLLLAASLTVLLAAPFYLTNLEMLWMHLSHELGETPLRLDRPRLHGFFIASLAHDLPLTGLMVPGLVWLALRGPRGSLGLVGVPLLVNQTLAIALSLPDPRHYLAGYPLEILAAFGWLLTLRGTRTVTWPLVLGLGLWHLGSWWTGTTPPSLRGGPLETLPGYRGCGPESLNARLSALTDATAEAAGPGVQVVAARVEPFPLSYMTLQALAASRKHPLLFRGMEEGQPSGPTQTANWAVKFASLAVPEVPAPEVKRRAEAPLGDLPEAWVLRLGPTATPQPPDLPLTHPLPAPPGFRAGLAPADRRSRRSSPGSLGGGLPDKREEGTR